MNVLHIDEQTGWRGGEQQASWLLQGLSARGHAVTLAGRPGSAFLSDLHGGCPVEKVALPFYGEWDLYTAWRLAQEVKQRRIDILHAHSSHAHTMAILARRFAGRGRVVVSRRVSFVPKNNPFNRWKYNQPDKVVAVSNRVGEVLHQYGMPASRLAVVHSSVDLARLEVPPLSRQELGVPGDVPLLVSAGALVAHKDHETLVAAFYGLTKHFPKAYLLIAGEGELRSALEAQIADLGLTGSVRLLGHRLDVPRLIRAADVYVSSSWSEGLGTSVLEALACKTPVVAAVAGGIPEMVKPGETGYLVPNRDANALTQALVMCLQNPAHSKKMAVQGRALVEARFTTQRMIEGTLKVYSDLVQS